MQPDKIDIGWVDPGYVSGHFAHSIAKQAGDLQYFEALGNVYGGIGSSLITASRNEVAKLFVEGDSDWLWMVDSDMVFDKGHWLKLINMAHETEADMVTGLTFMWRTESQSLIPSIFYNVGNEGEIFTALELPKNGQEIAACGLASVLVHRRVFEAMEAPRHPDYRWFDQIILSSGRLSGEDTQFFVRARELGFTLRVCTEAETWHVKEVGFGKQDYLKQQELQEAGWKNEDGH